MKLNYSPINVFWDLEEDIYKAIKRAVAYRHVESLVWSMSYDVEEPVHFCVRNTVRDNINRELK